MTGSFFQPLCLTGCSGHYQVGEGGADSCHRIYLAGTVFQAGRLLALPELTAGLYQAISTQQLSAFLASLDGFFSILLSDQQRWWLISDRLRSRPLFYRATTQGWLLSDSAWELLQAGDTLEPLASEEFLHCGYVTGGNTLIGDIHQIEAASYVCLPHSSTAASAERYALFWPQNAPSGALSDDDYAARLDAAMTAATQRLIQVAAGRPILLPLSGGYDSRALAIYLKKSAYPQVHCFTFGNTRSFEVERARQVAAALGFDLHQLVYRPADWEQLRHCPEFNRYLHQIHNLVSVPNVQVYLAIKQLRDSGLLPADVLVVPGHTGDFVSGGHIPVLSADASLAQLSASVWRRHFDHSRRAPSPALQAKLSCQLAALRGAGPADTPAASCAEAWNYLERQAKFIVNSNRYYDFWQLDWWMPLWDWQFVAVWQQVPLPLRRQKQLWIRLVNQQYQAITGCTPPPDDSKRGARLHRLAQRYLSYFLDPNYLFRLVPLRWWLKARFKLIDAAPSVFAYLAGQMLERLEDKLKQLDTKSSHKKNCI